MSSYEILLQKLQSAKNETERSTIALHFNLELQSKPIQHAVWASAIPHWFNASMLNSILPEPLTENQFQTLISLPYVEFFEGRGWCLHEKTRDVLRAEFWERDATEYKKLSRQLAVLFRKSDPKDPVWRIEALYHSLIAQESKATSSLIDTAAEWLNTFQFTLVEALVNPILNAGKCNRLTGIVIAYAYYFSAKIQNAWGNFRDAKTATLAALEVEPADYRLQAVALQLLGDIYIKLSEIPLAKEALSQSLNIYRDNNNLPGAASTIRTIGTLFFRISDYNQSMSLFHEARRLFQKRKDELGITNCDMQISDVNLNMGNYSIAKDGYISSMRKFEKLGIMGSVASCLKGLGNIYLNQSNFDTARKTYKDAILKLGTNKDGLIYAHCISGLARVDIASHKFSVAADLLLEARELYKRAGDQLGISTSTLSIGDTYLRLGDIDRALSEYNESCDISLKIDDPLGVANAIWSIGEAKMEMKDFSAAEKSFSDAILRLRELEIRPSLAQCFSSMGDLYARMEKYSEALALYDEAISYSERANLLNRRCEILMQLNDLHRAAEDLNTAEKLSPSYFINYLNKGRLALLASNVAEAKIHFENAEKECPDAGEVLLWKAFSLALSSEPWKLELDAAKKSIFLNSTIEEFLNWACLLSEKRSYDTGDFIGAVKLHNSAIS